MRATISSAAAIAGLCLASAAFSADESQPGTMGQPSTVAQPAPSLDVTQLPGAAQATLQREGRVTKVQEVSPGAKVYDATVSKDGKNYSLRVNADGTILTRDAAPQ